MTTTKNKIGFQHVGSFLRPDILKQARKDYFNNEITQQELTTIENEAIKDLVQKEAAVGLDYATDGEFRRSYWHLDFFWGLEGVDHVHYGEGYQFAHEETRDDTAILSGHVKFNPQTHPFIKDFEFLKSVTNELDIQPKQTIPAPSQLYLELVRGVNADKVKEYYPNVEDLYLDIEKAYHDAILTFYDKGARVIQLDDCSWGLFLDEKFLNTPDGKAYADSGIQDILLNLNNKAIENLPDDLTIKVIFQMALVLQNDPRGDHALGAGYQGLGVMGYDKATTKYYYSSLLEISPTNASTEYIASTAVQNSMALEFDTQKDDAISESNQEPIKVKSKSNILFPPGTNFYTLNGFDTFDTTGNLKIPDNYPANSRFGAGGTTGHIALIYPGLATSYALTPIGSANTSKSSWKGFTMADTLIHSDPRKAQLVDTTNPDGSSMYWHHVTFEWIPAKDGQSAEIHYAFNDKYLDGTTNTDSSNSSGYPLVTSTIKVDPDIFGNVTDNKLYWGFTGANGAGEKVTTNDGKTAYDVYSKLAVMESIPGLVNAEVDTSITDNTLGKIITDDSTDRTVAHGDKLTLDYHLKYDTETSRVNWSQIMADIHLPQNVTYTPDATGSIATINYKNDKTGNTATELVPGSNLSGNEIKFAISQALGTFDIAEYTSANIVINGIAQNTTGKNIDVTAQPAYFSGDHQISSTSTPNFTITYQKKLVTFVQATSTNQYYL